MITNEPITWPPINGDPIWKICHAIAFAEGANEAGSNPDRLNNPGDISDGSATFGFESHSGSRVTTFPDKEIGWQWLYNKIQRHIEGKSDEYPANLTITEFAVKYAGNWKAWKTNVGVTLGVDPNTIHFKDIRA